MAKIGTFNRIDTGKLPDRPKERDHIDVQGITVELKYVQDVPGYPMCEWARLISTPMPAKDYLTQTILNGVIDACLTDEGLVAFRIASRELLPTQVIDVAFKLYDWWAAVPFEELPGSSVGDTPTNGNVSASSAPTSPDSKQQESSDEKSQDQRRLEAIVSSGS